MKVLIAYYSLYRTSSPGQWRKASLPLKALNLGMGAIRTYNVEAGLPTLDEGAGSRLRNGGLQHRGRVLSKPMCGVTVPF